MRRFLIALIFVFGSLSGFCQKENNLPWSANRPLEWSDYQGTPQGDNSYEAVNMVYKLGVRYNMIDSANVTLFEIKVTPSLVRNESWIKSEKVSSELLAFERLRFDIVELYARRLRKEFSSMVFTKETFKQQIQGPYGATLKALQEALNQFDDETFFGTRKPEMDRWLNATWKELKELEAYQ
jgi:hypothetical protein